PSSSKSALKTWVETWAKTAGRAKRTERPPRCRPERRTDMRRKFQRLTDTQIKKAIKAAPAEGKLMLPDGDGLYLQVKDGVPSWLFRYSMSGKSAYMGLGALRHVTLAEARDKAIDARRLKRERIDPLQHRREQHQARAVGAAKETPTFAA